MDQFYGAYFVIKFDRPYSFSLSRKGSIIPELLFGPMSKPLIHDHSQTVQQVIFISLVLLVSLPPLLPVFNYSQVWLVSF